MRYFKNKNVKEHEIVAMTDTVYINHTDTVEIIKETIIDNNIPVDQYIIAPTVRILEAAYRKNDCSFEFCPDDMESFRRTKYKGDFANDSALADLMVTMQ
jgi:hypothetical protein